MDRKYLALLAVCVTLIFFVSGIRHLFTLKDSTMFLKSFSPFKQLPLAFDYLVEIVATLIEIIAPILILIAVVDNKHKMVGKVGACLLSIFIICTLLFIHNPFFEDEMIPFFKNLSFLGGVLLIERSL